MSLSPGQAVFLSYASQDAEAARRLCETLRGAGMEVWFDQNELVGGDQWDAKIRGQIASCALFVPVISAQTQTRLEGYFRLEWKLAAQRTYTMAEEKAFLLPIVIDDTREAEAKVPAEFKAVQWTRAPGGETPVLFANRVKQLLGGIEVGRVSDPPCPALSVPRAGQRPALPLTRRAPAARWAFAALGAVALGLLAFIALRRTPQAAPAPVPTKTGAEAKSATAAPPAVSEKSIAVLPFENRSVDPENAFFTDGVHDDILTHLTRISDLHVISRTSVMEYRGTTKKIPQIARELGVAFVLAGSVQRSGTSVHITGQLIRAATDQHVWADNYDRELTAANVFAIQSELAKAIAGELKAALLPQEKKLIERPPTASLEAYDCFLKARDLRDRFSTGGALVEAEKLLEQAVAIDPKFGIAWAKLAWVEALLGNRDEALRCAKKEMELRLASPDVWSVRNHPSALACVHAWTGDPASALAELARLLQLPCLPRSSNINVHTLRLHPAWFPLRGDPRFEALLNDPKNNAPLF